MRVLPQVLDGLALTVKMTLAAPLASMKVSSEARMGPQKMPLEHKLRKRKSTVHQVKTTRLTF